MQKLVPITRLGKFFGAEDYSLDIGMGEEWLLGDMNFTIFLYRVDRQKTKVDDVYGEVLEDGIQFLAPVELQGLVQVMTPASKNYGNSKIELQEPGNMKFSIYQKTLDDLDPVDINNGSFELDWNDKFVANLIKQGYKIRADDTDSQIVDRWFQTVCRNIALEVYEQQQADPDNRESDMRVIQQRDLGGGFTEVS
jgi:hypothetical protein